MQCGKIGTNHSEQSPEMNQQARNFNGVAPNKASNLSAVEATSPSPNASASSPSIDTNTAGEDRASGSVSEAHKFVSHLMEGLIHQQQNATLGNSKNRVTMQLGPAVIRHLQNLVSCSHPNESKFRETCEIDETASPNTLPSTQEQKSGGRQDATTVFRKASSPSSNIPIALDPSTSPEVLRAMIEQVDFGQACSESGALDELSVEALPRCFPESLNIPVEAECFRELFDWKKAPKTLGVRGRQATGGAGSTVAVGGGRHALWQMKNGGRIHTSGKHTSSECIPNQKANTGVDCNSLLYYPDDELLPGDQPFYFDERLLSTPHVDIRHIREKLSSSTLEEIGQQLREQMDTSTFSGASGTSCESKNNVLGKAGGTLSSCDCLLLMHRIREALEIAGAQLLNYDEKKRSQVNEPPEKSGDLHENGILHERLGELKSDRLEGLCKHLGISTATASGIYRAVSGTAVLLLFNTLSLSTLRKCCKELGIPTSEDPFMDVQLLPESLAEKISSYLCPGYHQHERLSFSHLHFLPHLQVHENSSASLHGANGDGGKGGSTPSSSFACTLDNAQFLGQLPLERYISNRFSCQKVKWRCMVVAQHGFLHLYLWHRYSSPLFARVSIWTPEERKKKKGRANGAGEKETGKQNATTSVANNEPGKASSKLASLCCDTSAVVEPNELVVFSNFLSIDQVLRTVPQDGCSQFYQRVEDRLAFQLTLQTWDINAREGPVSGNGEILKNTGKSVREKTGTELASTMGKGATDPIGRDAANLDDDRQQKELQLAVSSLADAENKKREIMQRDWDTGYRQLQYAEYREAIQARQAAKDRERKIRLAKAGPSSELQREVEKYRQMVQTSQQQVAKLTKEKTAEEKDWKRLREKADEGKLELERLRSLHDSKAEELAQLEEQTRAVQQRIEEKRRKAELRRQRREQSLWQDHVKTEEALQTAVITNANDALSINDLGLFLTNGVCGGGSSSGTTSDPIFHTSLHPLLSLQDDSFGFTTSGNVGSSLDLLGPGGNTTTGPGVSPSTPPNHGAAPPVFSTQPHLRAFIGGDDLGGTVECGSSLHISPSPHQLSGMQASPPLSTSPMVFNVGGAQGSNGLGANVHHGETSGSNLTSIGAFGAIGGPSPFSTNPAPHHSSMYAHLDTSPPAFHTTADVLGDHALGASLGMVHPAGGGGSPQRASISQPGELNPFTVTAGGASTSLGISFAAFTPDPNAVLYGPPQERCTPPAGSNSHLFYKTDLPNVEPFSTSTW